MAFRHGSHGVVPGAQRGTVWTCPTCQAENAGRLEEGCPQCRAGADAKSAWARGKAAADALDPVRGFPVHLADDLPDAFHTWFNAVEGRIDNPAGTWTQLKEAFLAGAAWKEKEMLAVLHQDLSLRIPPPAVPDNAPGGYTLVLIEPDGHTVAGPMATRSQATIVAALQFYVENTLAYGDLPGQLTVGEARTLIAQLLPKEEPSV